MKQRFSSLDVHVIASELSSALLTLRLANIYDLSSRIFLFKFAKPNSRQQLLVDSGFRCHLTSFTRTASTFPSVFVQKLRKHLKTRRVTGVRQVGTDRVVEITFSEGQYRLYLEFFAAGNIVLVDAELNVLALLRVVSEGDENVDVKVGGKYVLEAKQNFGGIPPLTEERVRGALERANARAAEAKEIGGKKAKRAKGVDDLRKALSAGFPEYPPHLLEHVFVEADVDVEWKIGEVLKTKAQIESIMTALEKANDVYRSLEGGEVKGYIIAKVKDGQSENIEHGLTNAPPRDTLLYDDFHPFRPSQFEKRPDTHILEFDGFNRTVDEFYSSIESQKLESRLNEREQAAERKLQTAKDEHAKRLGALQQVQELHIRKAQTIEANTHRLDEACAAVNGLIGQGMDWVDIGKLIENEQKRGNIVAQMVRLPLKLEENTVTLLLDEPTFEDDESEEEDRTDDELDSDEDDVAGKKSTSSADKRLTIDIDLALTPWQNARQYYDQKKQAASKEQKTMLASSKALKSTERKIQDDLKKGLKQEKAVLRPARKQFWFEKFLWFISSDGYLVIGGKDAQQNELLYRRYLKKGDVWVNADLQGAASVVVKNNPQTPDAVIPPSTLSQAGALTVCTSTAWESKAVMAAWWVNADQVSKTAQTGEYLQTGGFMVRGKKNFLPPSQLLLGFGVVWLISEESRANHGKHRVDRTENAGNGETEVLAEETSRLNVVEDDDQVKDDPNGTMPDVEEVGENAEQEVQEDAEATEADAEAQLEEEDEDEDEASAANSDNEPERSNPLQASDIKDNIQTKSNEAEQDEEDDNPDSDSDTSPSAVDEPTTSTRSETPQSTSTTPSSHPPATTNPPKQKQLARGKRFKQKRALKKYAEQSEDDRELAMALLGGNKSQEKKVEKEESEAARKEKAERDKERRRKQHQRLADQEKTRMAELAQNPDGAGTGNRTATQPAPVEEADADLVAQELHEHSSIDLLIPHPSPGDSLIAAIPMIAPYPALSRHKYKIKLQPGNAKKGKVVKEILGLWTGLAERGKGVVDEHNRDKERVWAREVELLRGWRVEEVVGNVPVKGARVVLGGGVAGGVGGAGGKGSSVGGRGKVSEEGVAGGVGRAVRREGDFG